jgi:hypothetical protein
LRLPTVILLLLAILLATAARAAPVLVPMAERRGIERDAPWQCSNYEPATRTCEGVARTTWREDGTGGTSEVAVLLSEKPRLALVMAGPVWAERDMECGRFADWTVKVAAADPLPPGAVAKIESEFRRQLAAQGTIACSGLTRDGEAFRAVDYRDGKPTGRPATLRFSTERPTLRVPDRGT